MNGWPTPAAFLLESNTDSTSSRAPFQPSQSERYALLLATFSNSLRSR